MDGLQPIVNSLNRPFWDAAEAGRLVLPYCVQSGRAFWPPSPSSPFTGGAVLWRDVAATGRLRSRVVYRRGFMKELEARMPYAVGLVELDAGPRLLAHIETPDAPGSPQPDERVAIHFLRLVEGGRPVPTARKMQT